MTVTSTNIKINFPTLLVPWPVLNHGGVDFKTMANQTAAKALEEVSRRVISVISSTHVSNLLYTRRFMQVVSTR